MPKTELKVNALVTERIEIHPDLIFLKVAPDGWEFEPFKAGQYAVLGLPGSAARCENSDPDVQPVDQDKLLRRAYSIGSSGQETNELEFFISLVASGGLSPRLLALRPGDPVYLAPKVKGTFTLEGVPEEKNLVLISTGTGITPYLSMVRGSALAPATRRVAILHGVRHSWDLGYDEELHRIQKGHINLNYVSTVSRPEHEKTPWEGHTGYVQSLWSSGVLHDCWGFTPSPEDTHIFLCGNPGMTQQAQELLESEGFTLHSKKAPGNLHVEKYW